MGGRTPKPPGHVSTTWRSRLTKERNTGERVKRATMELAVIVVGVLIALSADQWWASLADERTEAAYLSRMMDDISSASRDLNTQTGRAQQYLSASAELSGLPRTGLSISEDSLAVLVADGLFNLVGWDGGISTLDDLKNTGRLGLISDPEIRRGIAELDRLNAQIRSAEDDLLQTQHHTLDPFLIRSTDLPRLIPLTLPAATAYLGPAIGREHGPLLADPEFQNIVALRIVLLRNLERAYLETQQHLGDLSRMIATGPR